MYLKNKKWQPVLNCLVIKNIVLYCLEFKKMTTRVKLSSNKNIVLYCLEFKKMTSRVILSSNSRNVRHRPIKFITEPLRLVMISCFSSNYDPTWNYFVDKKKKTAWPIISWTWTQYAFNPNGILVYIIQYVPCFHRAQRLMLRKGAKRWIWDDITWFPKYFWQMTIARSEDINKDDTSIVNLFKNF